MCSMDTDGITSYSFWKITVLLCAWYIFGLSGWFSSVSGRLITSMYSVVCIKGFIVMQGLKSHAVTMFEVGKLNDESLDSFLTELGKVSQLHLHNAWCLALTVRWVWNMLVTVFNENHMQVITVVLSCVEVRMFINTIPGTSDHWRSTLIVPINSAMCSLLLLYYGHITHRLHDFWHIKL